MIKRAKHFGVDAFDVDFFSANRDGVLDVDDVDKANHVGVSPFCCCCYGDGSGDGTPALVIHAKPTLPSLVWPAGAINTSPVTSMLFHSSEIGLNEPDGANSTL